jgi:hypothetical protein
MVRCGETGRWRRCFARMELAEVEERCSVAANLEDELIRGVSGCN